MQQKVNWVNALKVLGILAVILGHIASPLGDFIFSWHMPLFFMAAGFFLKLNVLPKNFFTKDLKRLMIPYFIFAILGLLLEILKRIVLHRDHLNYLAEAKAIFIFMDMNSLINQYGFVLWFLPALFFGRSLIFLSNKFSKSILSQLFIIFVLFGLSFYIELPFAIDKGLNASIWIFFGFIFYHYLQENKILYCLPLLAVAIFLLWGMPHLNIATKSYSNVILNIFWALALIYIYIICLKNINYTKKTSEALLILADSSMVLFIVHPYTNNIAHLFVDKLNIGNWSLKFLISLILLTPLVVLKYKFNNRGIFKYV